MKYYLIAGEASGDLYGANLVRALREADPKAVFRYWGGDMMAEAVGEPPVRHIRDLAIMGFVEVAVHLKTVLGNIRSCQQDIAAFGPDVVIGIDYPGFNFRIAKWAHGQGYKTVHYISPNLWAWKKGRIKSMRRDLDCLCYILPFERQFFAENDMPQAVYVGHPLLDCVNKTHSSNQAIKQSSNLIALLPGSRRQELKNSLPLMIQLAQRHPEYRFVVAGMSLIGKAFYEKLIPKGANVEVVYDRTYGLLSSAHAAVVCSGTATLETALYNVPQVVCYSGNAISYVIARAIVSSRIKYISLVNLIVDKPVVTELIQNDFNLQRLEKEFALIAADPAYRQEMQQQYAEVRTLLGDGGASRATAKAIIDTLQ